MTRTLAVLGILFAAITFSAGLAHVLEMGRKLHFAADEYLFVQQLYRGWAFVGVAMFLALLTSAWWTIRLRQAGRPFGWAALGALAIAAAVGVFFAATFPVNRATADWTTLPPDWEALRKRWEYSHAVGAGLMFLALTALAVAAVTAGDR
jgi:hypothetical protein